MPKRKSRNGQSFSTLTEYMRSLNAVDNSAIGQIKSKKSRITADQVSAVPSGEMPAEGQSNEIAAGLKAIDNTLKTEVVGGLNKLESALTGSKNSAPPNVTGKTITQATPAPGSDIKNTFGNVSDVINTKSENTSTTNIIPAPSSGEERLHNSEVNNIKKVEVENIINKKEKDTEDNKLKVSSKRESEVSEKALAKVNPEADNVESANEKLIKVSIGVHQAIGELIGVSKSQLTALNNIKENIAPSGTSSPQGTSSTISSKPTEPAAAEPTPATTGPGLADLASALPDMAGKGKTPIGSKLEVGKKSLGSKVLGGLKGAGRVLGKFAVPIALGMSAMDAAEGYQNANENLDIQGREATLGEKLSSGAGSAVSGLSFGLLDAKTASKGIHSIGSSASDLWDSAKSAIGKTVDRGKELANETVQGMDLARQAVGGGPNGTVINNSVNNSSSTKFVPMKSSPRPESQGSALDRYQNRITSY